MIFFLKPHDWAQGTVFVRNFREPMSNSEPGNNNPMKTSLWSWSADGHFFRQFGQQNNGQGVFCTAQHVCGVLCNEKCFLSSGSCNEKLFVVLHFLRKACGWLVQVACIAEWMCCVSTTKNLLLNPSWFSLGILVGSRHLLVFRVRCWATVEPWQTGQTNTLIWIGISADSEICCQTLCSLVHSCWGYLAKYWKFANNSNLSASQFWWWEQNKTRKRKGFSYLRNQTF